MTGGLCFKGKFIILTILLCLIAPNILCKNNSNDKLDIVDIYLGYEE
jgi:hypothetical protein